MNGLLEVLRIAGKFVVGCLVQSSFGKARGLRFGNMPVGRLLQGGNDGWLKKNQDHGLDMAERRGMVQLLSCSLPMFRCILRNWVGWTSGRLWTLRERVVGPELVRRCFHCVFHIE